MSPRFRQDSLKYFVSTVCSRLRRDRSRCARRRISLYALGLAACFATAANATPPATASSPDNTYFTHSDFALPFQVKPGGRCPQQLDLLVSRDAGRTWHVYQTAAPAEGRFRLAQVEEGEYWLKVQVRDAAGSSTSNSVMRLCVDRTRPKANIDCQWQSDGRLFFSSKIEESHIDLQSIKLTLRTDGDQQAVAVPLDVASQPDGAVCSAVLDMPACKSFELKLTVSDRARNPAMIAERYFHPVLAGPDDVLLPASDEPKQTPAAEDNSVLEIAKSEWTTIELGTPTALAKAQLTSADASKSIVRKPQRHVRPPEELIPPERPLELSIEPPMAPVPSPPAAPVPSPTIAQVQSASRKFKIHYNLAQAVPADQLNVELWVTVDKGATWEFWGMDRDAQSPAWIEVDTEGEYGFCVVCIHSETDLKFRPKAGDNPDLSVTVKEPPTKRKLEPAARD